MDETDYNYYSRSSPSEKSDMASFPAGGILFFSVTFLFVGILTWQAACKFCRKSCTRFHRCCGCCPSDDFDDLNERDSLNDEEGDRQVALALQRQLNEEASERNRMAKRKERRMWYLYYLRPWTMTVKESDLIHEHQNDSDSSTQEESDEDGTITVQTGSQDTSEDHSDDGNDNDKDNDIIDLEDGESQDVCLRLPASTGGRCVDGTCALCLDEYSVGDQVVWSSCPECKHVFHKECFLLWLSKGKKRCPICRHWFVPGQKIDDQKILHGKAWTDALAEMIRAEKEEIARKETAKQQQELEQQQRRAEETAIVREADQGPEGSSTSNNNDDNDDPEQDNRLIKTTNSSRSCGTASASEDSEQFFPCNSNDSSL